MHEGSLSAALRNNFLVPWIHWCCIHQQDINLSRTELVFNLNFRRAGDKQLNKLRASAHLAAQNWYQKPVINSSLLLALRLPLGMKFLGYGS